MTLWSRVPSKIRRGAVWVGLGALVAFALLKPYEFFFGLPMLITMVIASVVYATPLGFVSGGTIILGWALYFLVSGITTRQAAGRELERALREASADDADVLPDDHRDEPVAPQIDALVRDIQQRKRRASLEEIESTLRVRLGRALQPTETRRIAMLPRSAPAGQSHVHELRLARRYAAAKMAFGVMLLVLVVPIAALALATVPRTFGPPLILPEPVAELAEFPPILPTSAEGTGDVHEFRLQIPGPDAVLFLQHEGQGAFGAWANLAGGPFMLVQAQDQYEGSHLLRGGDARSIGLEIKASGTWRARVSPITSVEQSRFVGRWDGVSGQFAAPPGGLWRLDYTGAPGFAVTAHCTGGQDRHAFGTNRVDTRVNVTFRGSPCLWEVHSRGSWVIEPVPEPVR
jgi:hypothetical protein